jgi:hypothetical protein
LLTCPKKSFFLLLRSRHDFLSFYEIQQFDDAEAIQAGGWSYIESMQDTLSVYKRMQL